ncbi:AI-2E family transporter [Nocardia amikacinitolerans]|uniref:AI-2E family transporter n=1 Tax=Nocardia amikacinitolerans TaxID=756689 RepID=UPI0020A533EF|nr:AI-2E family transporter [Nocardia amikacinitolerans]MCP2290300.1 putative PurR-regulated permease PerM [Nocardia amikacinitolerans]
MPTAADHPGPSAVEPEATRSEKQPPDRRGGVLTDLSAGPPPWLLRAFLLAAATIAGLIFGFWVLQRLQGLLTVLMVSLFLAFAIEPAVNWLAARGVRRGLATGVVFLGLLMIVVGFVWTLGSLLVDQVTTLVQNAPEYADRVVDWVNDTFNTELSGTDIQKYATEWSDQIEGYLVGLAENAWGIGTAAIGALFQILGVLLFTYYFAADGPRFRNAMSSLLPPHRQRHVLRAWDIAVEKTGGYIYSRGLLAVCSTLAHYVVLRLLDVPSAFALALWVGVVSQFIPTVGTYLAGALPVIVALVNGGPGDGLWILGFIVLYQQFENYVLQPRITATTLDMHPAVAFGAVIAGAALLGPTGALLAIPVTATVQAFAGAYIRRYEVETEVESPAPEPTKPNGRKRMRELMLRLTRTQH